MRSRATESLVAALVILLIALLLMLARATAHGCPPVQRSAAGITTPGDTLTNTPEDSQPDHVRR